MKRIGGLDRQKLERTERFGGMYFCNDMWQDEYVYQGNLWLTQWYCNNVERLTELTWNGMEWIRDHMVGRRLKGKCFMVRREHGLDKKDWPSRRGGKRNR